MSNKNNHSNLRYMPRKTISDDDNNDTLSNQKGEKKYL